MNYIATIIISYGPMTQNMIHHDYYIIIIPYMWLQNKLMILAYDDSIH